MPDYKGFFTFVRILVPTMLIFILGLLKLYEILPSVVCR